LPLRRQNRSVTRRRGATTLSGMSEARTTINPLHRRRLRRVARPWRIAFIFYALALTTGTHWPRLTLGPEIPATDKLIHLLAFGGLTILLWRTRWIASKWAAAIIALAWAAADELSQGIAALNRTVSWHDVIANVLGVGCALAWLWALGPVGHPAGANRSRLRLHAYVFDEMFARSGPWLALVGGLAAGAVPLWFTWRSIAPALIHTAIVIGLVVAAIVTLAIWLRIWQRRWDETLMATPCLECGQRVYALDFRNVGSGRCESCGSRVNATLWIEPADPRWSLQLGVSLKPAILASVALAAGFGLVLATPLIYSSVIARGSPSHWAPRLAHAVANLPRELTSVIDLAMYLLLLAVVVRIYRTGLAKWHDRAIRCRRCGHDLRGTPTLEGTDGLGRCSECGTPFVRAKGIEPPRHTGAGMNAGGLASQPAATGEMNASP
jgi:DNA-directed RNA polymerase subunit RPC12/RpoP